MRRHKIRNANLQAYCERNPTAHGGALQSTRYGRSRKRMVSNASTMNVTLRSTQARGPWSFRQPKNRQSIDQLTERFAARFNVYVLRLSNVGNHLHFHLKFPGKKAYLKFIRALTAAIAVAITGCTRWAAKLKKKFWDLRPFTRIIFSVREHNNFEAYLDLNDMEGDGIRRATARWIVSMRKWALRQSRFA